MRVPHARREPSRMNETRPQGDVHPAAIEFASYEAAATTTHAVTSGGVHAGTTAR
jgi:hypothetical protein